jgi:Domain of unknown function (DUF4010)
LIVRLSMRVPILDRLTWARVSFDHPFDHPDDPTGSFSIQRDRRGTQREHPRSFWSRPVRGYGPGGWRRASLEGAHPLQALATGDPDLEPLPVGYVAARWLGAGRGTVLTGITGGLVSSTAVTLSFARRSRDEPAVAAALACGILLRDQRCGVRNGS